MAQQMVRDILADDALVQALGQRIVANADVQEDISQLIGANIATDIRAGAGGQIGQAIAVAMHGMHGMHGMQAPVVDGDDVTCGTLPTQGEEYRVRPGFCFPDNAACHGSILKNPNDESVPITTEEIFRRDSLFTNFENTQPRNLGEMIDVTNAAFVIDGDNDVFNYRNFFFVNPSDRSLIEYNQRGPYSNLNIVRLRYDTGLSYPRESENLSLPSTNPIENAEIEAGKKLVPTFSIKTSWTICPEFFTYRMLPLKPGYMSAYGYGKINKSGQRSMPKCTGVKVPGDNMGVNDVYVYTFVDSNGILVSNATEINKKKRVAENSFQGGDLPYEDGFFIFPKDRNGQTVDTVVCARYPDGILLFGYQGRLTPIPPFGTIVNKKKLHTETNQRPGYPDQVAHQNITYALSGAMASLLVTNAAAFNAKTINLNGADRQIDSVPNVRDIIAGGVGYIAMMSALKEIVRREKLPINFGGSHRNRRYNHKSIKRNKSKSKSKGRGRARAASMLKSAKQRFYRRGGGGMGMSLGLGSSGPKPLQYDSPLVSQASPV